MCVVLLQHVLHKLPSSRTALRPPSCTKKTCGSTYYETDKPFREAGATPGDADVLIGIQINDDGMLDATTLDLHLEILDELDQEPVPLFIETRGSQIRQLLLRRYIVNAHVLLLDDLADVEVPQSHVVSSRAVGLVSGYLHIIMVYDAVDFYCPRCYPSWCPEYALSLNPPCL